MLRGIYGDPERYKQTYWSRFPGMYFAGDGAKRDSDGYLWLLGRVDDVMNVSGHRLSTTEIESALVSPPGRRRGRGRRRARTRSPARRSTRSSSSGVGNEPTPELGEELREHVATKISPIAKPKTLMFTPDLPKTRSGKIMRRLLRTSPRAGPSATRPRSPTPASSRRSASTPARPRTRPACRSNFLRRKKAPKPPPRRPRRPTAAARRRVGNRLRRPDRGVAAASGGCRSRGACRTRSTGGRRSRSPTCSGRRSTARRRCQTAPGPPERRPVRPDPGPRRRGIAAGR